MVNYNKLSTRNSFKAHERKLDFDKVQNALDRDKEKRLLEHEEILNKSKIQPNDPRLIKKEKNPNKFTETYKFINGEVERYFMESFRNIIIKSNILDKDLVVTNSVSISKTANELLENLLDNINLQDLNKSEIGILLYENILDKVERGHDLNENLDDIDDKISIVENTYDELLHENVLNIIVLEKKRKQDKLIVESKVEDKKNVKYKDKVKMRNTSLLEALLTFNSKLNKDEVLNESEKMEKSNFCLSESIMQYSFLEALRIMNLVDIDETKFIDKLKYYKIK
jgi:hypothetical protein